MELDPSPDESIERSASVSVQSEDVLDLGVSDSSGNSLPPELSVEVVDEVNLILVRDLVFVQTSVDRSEGSGCSHVSLHRSLEGFPLS